MRFVDDDEVVIAPVDVGEFDVARESAVAGEIGVIEDVVIEAIGGEDVAAVVSFVDRPVVAQPLGAEDENAVVTELVVFDHRERLEGFSEADRIGDDAAAKTGELVDRPDDAIPLKLVEFFPHDRGANAGGGVDDPVFVEPLAIAAEETIEDERVDQRWGPGFRELPHLADELGSLRVSSRNGRPLGIKPGGEGRRFLGRIGALEERQSVGGRKTKPGRREGDGTNHGAGRGASCVAGYKHALGDRARGQPDIDSLHDKPLGAARREPARQQHVSRWAVCWATEEREIGAFGWQQQPGRGGISQIRLGGTEGEERELATGHIEPALGGKRRSKPFEDPIRAGVGEELHEQLRLCTPRWIEKV